MPAFLTVGSLRRALAGVADDLPIVALDHYGEGNVIDDTVTVRAVPGVGLAVVLPLTVGDDPEAENA